MDLSLRLGIGSLVGQGGAPLQVTINGLRYQRLMGAKGQYLSGASGTPLYGRVA